MLASQLHVNLGNQQTEMLAMIHNLVSEDPPPAIIEQPVANAAINTVHELMIQILQAMQAAQANGNIARQGQENGNNARPSNQHGNGGVNHVNYKTPDNASFNHINESEYCHTHGACNH